jgi:hypothetical protein
MEGDGAGVTVSREKKKKERTYRQAGKVGMRACADAQMAMRVRARVHEFGGSSLR